MIRPAEVVFWLLLYELLFASVAAFEAWSGSRKPGDPPVYAECWGGPNAELTPDLCGHFT